MINDKKIILFLVGFFPVKNNPGIIKNPSIGIIIQPRYFVYPVVELYTNVLNRSSALSPKNWSGRLELSNKTTFDT